MRFGKHLLGGGAALLLAVTLPAAAQQRMIEVAVNTAELVQLQNAPGSVLVANPAIADVVVEGGRHVFVLGKAPGETQLFVLDGNGGTMLRAAISVVPQTARHLNVIRGGDETQLHCAPRCAPTPGQEKKAGAAPAAAPAPAPAPAAAPAPGKK